MRRHLVEDNFTDHLRTLFYRIIFIILVNNDDYLCNGNDSNLLIVFYVQIMPDDFVMQLHRF
ncbi:hypothetical protein F3K11_11015 [Escherichia coli]|nr:hypothetical protein [Escherichia coli]